MTRRLGSLLLILAVVALDQLTKAIVVERIALHDYIPVFDGLLSLSHVRNHGAAFGLLSDWNVPYQSWLLSAMSLAALSAITAYFLRLPQRAWLPRLSLSLVLGGAVGNVIDRLRLGYVVDFVHVYFRDYQWPDFNVADSAITIGVALLVIDILSSPEAETRGAATGIDTAAPAGRTD